MHHPPIDPETLPPGEGGPQTIIVEVFASHPEAATPLRSALLGRITICPGLVAPGHLAAITTSDGSLIIGTIHYLRSGEQEEVYLESLVVGGESPRYRLCDVRIEGEIIEVQRTDEEG